MNKNNKNNNKMKASCDTCEYFDFDEELQEDACTVDIDQDDMFRLSENQFAACPYYKYYNEYKSVQKQN